MPDHAFSTEIFPNIQYEPPLMQLEAIASHPVTKMRYIQLHSHVWFSFPIRPLFGSDHGWLGCFGLLCRGRPWGPAYRRCWRLVPGSQLRWPLIHPQRCLNGAGSVVGRRHAHSSNVPGEPRGSVLGEGGLGERPGERLWAERLAGGPWFCVGGCRRLLCHCSSSRFPPRHSPKP